VEARKEAIEKLVLELIWKPENVLVALATHYGIV